MTARVGISLAGAFLGLLCAGGSAQALVVGGGGTGGQGGEGYGEAGTRTEFEISQSCKGTCDFTFSGGGEAYGYGLGTGGEGGAGAGGIIVEPGEPNGPIGVAEGSGVGFRVGTDGEGPMEIEILLSGLLDGLDFSSLADGEPYRVVVDAGDGSPIVINGVVGTIVNPVPAAGWLLLSGLGGLGALRRWRAKSQAAAA
jgi:hypothetical protein